MTDRRYQRALNSLVKEDKRQRINPPAARPPVPGGTGYAANSPPEESVMDKVYLCMPDAVHEIGPPPLVASTEVLDLSTVYDPEMITVIGDDIFTVVDSGSGNTQIYKNLSLFKSGFTEIICMTGSSTELYVLDGGTGGDADPVVYVYDAADGGLHRTLASGTEDWQGSGTLDSVYNPITANDTNFVIAVDAGAHQGYWIYDSDFTYVDKIAFTQTNIRGSVSLRPDKLYIVDQEVAGNWKVRIFNLTGTLLDSQSIPSDYNSYTAWDVTDRHFYMCKDSGSDKLIVAFPRETDKDTFDFTSPSGPITETGEAQKNYVETNRDMTELF